MPATLGPAVRGGIRSGTDSRSDFRRRRRAAAGAYPASVQIASATARLRRWAAANPQRVDLALALLTCAAALPTMLFADSNRAVSVAPGFEALRLPLLLLMTLPIAFRRGRPTAVLVVVVVASLAAGMLGYSGGPAAFALIMALASASFYRGRPTAVVAGVFGAATVVLMNFAFLPSEERMSAESLTFNVAVLVLALLTGDVLRGHRDALSELAERNRRLERLRDVETREAVAQDRVRIARELHDIVGHALAAITLQARAGQRQIARDRALAAATFEQIEDVASRALGETRTAVGVIRSGSERAELRPQPTLGDLPELVRAVSASDVHVTLRREGANASGGDGGGGHEGDRDVPPAVQASAYRIVQESLANVVKHARPASVTVTVSRAADGTLCVAVRDDGRAGGSAGAAGGSAAGAGADDGRAGGSGAGGGAAGAGADDGREGGSGLNGMRVRAAQLGGTFAAGPAAGGGWIVEAELPVRTGARA